MQQEPVYTKVDIALSERVREAPLKIWLYYLGIAQIAIAPPSPKRAMPK